MTGRPLGAKQTNRQTWATTCVKCGCTLINVGSGRPRNNCGNHKKIRILVGKAESARRRVAYARNKLKRQHALVNALKKSVGECYYHEQYFGHELLVTDQSLRAFCWDHIDRADKVDTIAQMIGSYTDNEIIAEINKCVLSCTNCHQIKTYEQKDYASLKQAKTTQEVIDMQLKLFAI
jgi:cytochrome c553